MNVQVHEGKKSILIPHTSKALRGKQQVGVVKMERREDEGPPGPAVLGKIKI